MPSPAIDLPVPATNMTDTLRRSMQTVPLDDCPSQSKATKRKSKSVRFDTSGPESKRCTPEPTSDAQMDQPQSFTTFDLKAAQSVCDHLSQACASTSTCPDPCLGYLEHCSSVSSSRLIFYDASRNNIIEKHRSRDSAKQEKSWNSCKVSVPSISSHLRINWP